MNSREKKFVAYWSKKRNKGKLDFILKSGLTWGSITAILTELVALNGRSVFEALFSDVFLFRLVVFLIFGTVFFGWILWGMNERKYFKLKDSEDVQSP